MSKPKNQGAGKLVSQAKFAELHGVSRKTVTIWKADGYLVLVDGQVDLDASDSILRGAKLGRYRNGQGKAVEGTAPETRAKTAPVTQDRDEDPPAKSLEEFLVNLQAGNLATVAEADAIKANALAAQRVQEWMKHSGALIEMSVAENILFEQFRAVRDAWMNWPTRIGAQLAAELGVDADTVIEALTRHVQDHLADLGEPDADFDDAPG